MTAAERTRAEVSGRPARGARRPRSRRHDEQAPGQLAHFPDGHVRVETGHLLLVHIQPDVRLRPGDEITLTYLPGRGSAVEISGVRKGTIPGKAFADAYFACAIGPRPGPGEGFKKRLLGRP